MRRALVLVLSMLLLGACVASEPEPQIDSKPIPLRNPTAPVASQANVGQQDMLGDWTVIEGAGPGVVPGAQVRFGPDTLTLGPQTEALQFIAQGRFMTSTGPIWVHWHDVSKRSAALGDPNGSRVMILDRSDTISPDRRAAARKILAWYGYRLPAN